MAKHTFTISTQSKRGQALHDYLLELAKSESFVKYYGPETRLTDIEPIKFKDEDSNLLDEDLGLESGLS